MEKPVVEKIIKTDKIRRVIDKNVMFKIYSGLIALLSSFNIVWFFLPVFNVTNYHKISLLDLFLGLIGVRGDGTVEYFLLHRTEIMPITVLIIFMSVLLVGLSIYLIVMNLLTILKKKYKFLNNQIFTCSLMVTGLIVLAAVIYATIVWHTKALSLINGLLLTIPVFFMIAACIGCFVISMFMQKNEILDEEKKKLVSEEK